jgi:hypothetical protein
LSLKTIARGLCPGHGAAEEAQVGAARGAGFRGGGRFRFALERGAAGCRKYGGIASSRRQVLSLEDVLILIFFGKLPRRRPIRCAPGLAAVPPAPDISEVTVKTISTPEEVSPKRFQVRKAGPIRLTSAATAFYSPDNPLCLPVPISGA